MEEVKPQTKPCSQPPLPFTLQPYRVLLLPEEKPTPHWRASMLPKSNLPQLLKMKLYHKQMCTERWLMFSTTEGTSNWGAEEVCTLAI